MLQAEEASTQSTESAMQSEVDQLKASLASAQQALEQAQRAETALGAELKLSRANQASAHESLRQAEQSVDSLQHELSQLQRGEASPRSPDAHSQNVSRLLHVF